MSERLKRLKKAVVEKVDPIDYYRTHFPDWSGEENDLVECPRGANHEGGDDSTASLCLNPSTGAFNCYGCGLKGTTIVGYETEEVGDFKRSIEGLYARYVRNSIEEEN